MLRPSPMDLNGSCDACPVRECRPSPRTQTEAQKSVQRPASVIFYRRNLDRAATQRRDGGDHREGVRLASADRAGQVTCRAVVGQATILALGNSRSKTAAVPFYSRLAPFQ